MHKQRNRTMIKTLRLLLAVALLAVTLAIRPVAGAATPLPENEAPLTEAVPETIADVPGVTAEWWAAVQEEIRQDMAWAAASLSTSADWIAQGQGSWSHFGYSVGAAGDVNGDGYADLVVGAFGYANYMGRAYVYHGSASGLRTSPNWTDTGESAGDYFGHSVGTAGDVNGDGYADVVVGADRYNSSTGKAYVYHGSASGLSTSADWTDTGEYTSNCFGSSVGTAGDVNGDGYADLVVGADKYGMGKVYVYHGSASGLSASADWTDTGEATNSNFGHSVGTAGDVNSDGYADLVVGAHEYQTYTGKAYVYHGSANGLSTSANWTATGEGTSNYFGCSVGTAGDVNGDGYADLVVGAYGYSVNTGKAYVYHGSASGLSASANWTATGEDMYNYFGGSVGTAGDVNGDGYANLVVGAYGYDSYTGKAYVYHGSASGLSSSANWTATGEDTYNDFGYSVGTAGDVNGDGYADLVVGAYRPNTYQGKAYVYHGGASGLPSSAEWTDTGAVGATRNDFGYSVGTAGDVNGDGYADLVVEAYYYNSRMGKAYVYHGGTTGLSSSADWTATGENTGDCFGGSVGTAGDVNGDGYADLVVGAYGYSSATGRAYVYHGSASGLISSADWTATGEGTSNYFGSSVGMAGDINGDGYADLVVVAYGYDSYTGKVYVYHGGASGLSASANWTDTGENTWDSFGYSVGTAGDVNSDGYADLVVGAYYYNSGAGKAYVYHGGTTGLSSSADWTATGEGADNYFGYSAATAGDVNGDGYADLVVVAIGYSSETGKAYVYHGGTTGLSASANWTDTGENPGDSFGYSVGTAGDVNGDGYTDLVVGADGYNSRTGKAYVYHGGTTGLSSSANWTDTGEATWNLFGCSVGTAGDVNGDGYADLVVGAYGYNNFLGRVYVFHGSASGLSASADWTATGEGPDDFAISVETAGDINGDGYADLVVGAYGYSSSAGRAYVYHGNSSGLGTLPDWTADGPASSSFGHSVGTAGDVNGDGYADLVVGAYGYDSYTGKAYVYHGSVSGLSLSATWTATGENAGDRFGYSVGTAGDVNGDGYADLVAGAYHYNSSTGKAYVYHGSATGLSSSPNWTATGESVGDRFGRSAGTAGDVNGDGYADLVAGADGYSSVTGKAYVYHGSASSLSASANWTASGEGADNYFGWSVGTAGDVNGDGYADLVVGAIGYNSETGRAYVYQGGASSLSASANWTASGEGANSNFGHSVGTAGDVNGDGYADLVVGAYYYNGRMGKAYVYHGSASGLSSSADWTDTGENTGDYFGYSVRTAGDVNGDGHADLAIGACGYSDHKGKAYVYRGGGGGGRLVLARQGTGGSWTPVQPWSASSSASSFQVRLNATDPMGRGRVKLQVEACPPGVAFGDASCTSTTSSTWTDVTATANGVTLEETIAGLTSATLYHWRGRVLYAPYSVTAGGITPPPNPAHGPWRRFLGQALEADLRTLVPAGTGPGGVGNNEGTSSLALWLQADAGTYSDAGCSSAATGDGSVACWADQSGNGTNIGQSTGDNQPTYVASGLNGLPLIRFDGSTDHLMETSAVARSPSDITILAVASTAKSGSYPMIVTQGTGSTDGWQLFWNNYSPNLALLASGSSWGSNQAGSSTDPTADQAYVLTGWRSGTTTRLCENGSCVDDVGDSGNIDYGATPNLMVGARKPSAPESYQDRDIAEVILYSTALNSAQRMLAENYLAAKYGLTISNDHYDSTTYTMDVAGICQESDGSNTEGHSAGMIVSASSGFLQDNGDDLLFGHNTATNGTTSADCPNGVTSRWTRVWYIDKTDVNSNGGDVTVTFDFSESGLGGTPSGSYTLLKRSGETGTFSGIATSSSISGDQVIFSNVDSTNLGSYFTLGQGTPTSVTLTTFAARAAGRVNGFVLLLALVALGVVGGALLLRARPRRV